MRDRIDIPLLPMPTEADIDRYTDEAYERERDQFSVVRIIEKAKGAT